LFYLAIIIIIIVVVVVVVLVVVIVIIITIVIVIAFIALKQQRTLEQHNRTMKQILLKNYIHTLHRPN